MTKTIIRRFIILIPQLIALSVLIFILGYIAPGDALRGRIGPGTTMEQMELLREVHGLNDPWYVQYASWMKGILTELDFGRSFVQMRPVTEVIGDRIVNTMRLSFLTTIITYIIAIPLGIIAARKKETAIDRGIMMYTFLALSLPTIVFSLITLLIFGFNLRWFPTTGSVSNVAHMIGGITKFFSQMQHAILPAITLGILSTTGIIYFLRSEIIENENSDYVATARAKGVPENKVYTRHILRNALLPIAGNFGMEFAWLFMGAPFIEWVFSFSGMGELFISSILLQDWPVANTLILFFAVVIVVSMLITDIIITVIDPRIRIK